MNIRVVLSLLISLAVILTACVSSQTKADDSIGMLITTLDTPAFTLPVVERESFATVIPAVEPEVEVIRASKTLQGKASYYGRNHHGRRTASGQRFNMWAMTAAHKTLPFGTCLAVVNTKTEQKVIVTINDRGPYHGNRVLDLSQGAAGKIGMIKSGVATIKYYQVKCPGSKTKYI